MKIGPTIALSLGLFLLVIFGFVHMDVLALAERIQAGWIYAVLAVAPGVFFLIFFYRRDKWEREPPLLVLATFFGGALMVMPVIAVFELGIAAKLYTPEVGIVNSIVFTPLTEETMKFLVVLLIAYPRRAFNEPMDGIVYATAAALGFASLENIFYVLNALKESESEVVTMLIARALLAVPGHALDAVPWGLALGLAKFGKDRYAGRRMIILGLGVGIGLHAAWNFLAASPWGLGGYVVVLAVIEWQFVGFFIRIALAESPFAPTPQDPEKVKFWG